MEFVECSTEITELAKALLNVQKEMSPAMKDGKNPFTKSNYATLNSVMESCRQALLKNNIWLCQYQVPVETPDAIGLMTKLTHAESGQWQASLAVVPLPRADPQGMGSAITYARRYGITAMLGMVTEDDDGEAAKIPTNRNIMNKSAQNANLKPSHTVLADSSIPDLERELSEFPQIEGVNFEIVIAQDGRNCIVASGNTQSNRSILSKEGFRWNPQRKVWWKYANAI